MHFDGDLCAADHVRRAETLVNEAGFPNWLSSSSSCALPRNDGISRATRSISFPSLKCRCLTFADSRCSRVPQRWNRFQICSPAGGARRSYRTRRTARRFHEQPRTAHFPPFSFEDDAFLFLLRQPCCCWLRVGGAGVLLLRRC